LTSMVGVVEVTASATIGHLFSLTLDPAGPSR
jgi:hypothetical protein